MTRIPGIPFRYSLPEKTGSFSLIMLFGLALLYVQRYKSNMYSAKNKKKDTVKTLSHTMRILRPIQTSTTGPANRAKNCSNLHIYREGETTGPDPTLSDGTKSKCELCQEFDLSKNSTSSEKFDCILMRFKPSVPVCLYSTERDIYVSGDIRTHGI